VGDGWLENHSLSSGIIELFGRGRGSRGIRFSFVTFFFYMIFLKNEFPGYLLTVGV
jgi:hypothetical protein